MDSKFKIESVPAQRKQKILYWILVAVLIAGFQLLRLNQLNILWVNDDEMGYWGNAAYFAGHDWSGILQYGNYYSFGYGVFLAPLFIIFKNPVMLYRAAIFLNVLFLIVAFAFAYKTAEQIYPKIDVRMNVGLSMISVLTSGAVVEAEIAWSETLILLLTWLLIFCFVKYLYTEKTRYFYLFLVGNILIYMVHQRMVGVVIASGMMLTYCVYKKKVSKKQLLIAGVIIILGLFFASLIKEYTQTALWAKDMADSKISAQNVNDYSGQMDKLKLIFSNPENFLDFILLAFGKLLYFSFASYLGVYLIAYSWIHNCIKKENTKETLVLQYVLLSIMGMIAITTIGMYPTVRNDATIYGRYAESLTGPVILLAFGNLLNLYQKQVKENMLVIGFGAVLDTIIAYIVALVLWQPDMTPFSLNCIAMGRYIDGNTFLLGKFIGELWIMTGILLIIIFLYSYRTKAAYGLLGLALLFVYNNEAFIYKLHIENWQSIKKNVLQMLQDNAAYLDNSKNETVYYMLQGDFNKDANRSTLQFAMQDKTVVCVDIYNYEDKLEEAETLFIDSECPVLRDIVKEYDVLDQSGTLLLCKKR